MTEYFLSYSRADQAMALRFAGDLIAGGVKVWVDQYDIAPSQHWDRTVEAALRACDGLVLILSPRSAASPNVADEVSVAIDSKKHLIPILIEPCVMPLRLTRVQFIDATQDYEAALRRCLAAIKGPPRSLAAAAAASAIDPAALALAEARLAAFVGPIAAELVRRASVRAQSLADFHDDLASRLPDAAARQRFLGSLSAPAPTPPPPPPPGPAPPAPAPAPVSVSAEAVATLTKALAHHIGPIAAALVSREKASAQSPDDLRQRLAARIPEHERAAFLKETRLL